MGNVTADLIRRRPLILFGIGMMFLTAKQIWHSYELALLPFAVVAIVAAHVLNYNQSRRRRVVRRTDIRFPDPNSGQFQGFSNFDGTNSASHD